MSGYDALHRQCRTLESLFDAKLTAYARLASSIGRGGDDAEASGSRARWSEVEEEVDDLLEKLRETNASLSALEADSVNPPSQSMVRAIHRHGEVLRDYERDFARTRQNVKTALDRENLISGVRNDIDAYKSSAGDSLLAERGRIDSSHRMIDETLEQAYETRAEFNRQSNTLAGINARMQSVINTMPGINNLLSMIKTRRMRDAIIMGLVIGVCLILLLTYTF